MAAVDQGANWLAGRLLAASLQGALVIGLVWLVSWRFPSMPPSVRALLWWLASLKLMLALANLPAVSVPLLPAEPQVTVQVEAAAVADSVPAPYTVTTATATAEGSFPGWSSRSKWIAASLALWLLGVGAHTVVLVSGFRRLRRVLAGSIPSSGDDAALAKRLAAGIGLRTVPDVRLSDAIDSPQVVRARRPVIVLPSNLASSMTAEERAMVLCHELVHVRRRDLLIGWVPACAERIFFFHPLARLAAREFVLAREAICDAAVLQTLGVAPLDYGRFLLRLGIRHTHPGLSAAASSRSASSLRRRLDMLHHGPHFRPRRMIWLAAALAICALPPLQLVARTPETRKADTNVTSPASPSTVTAARDRQGAPVRRPDVEAPADLLTLLRAAELLRGALNVAVEGWVELDGPNVHAADLQVRLEPNSEAQTAAEAARAAEAAAAAEARRAREMAKEIELRALVDRAQKEVATETQAALERLAAETRQFEQVPQAEQAARASEQAASEVQRATESLEKGLHEMAARMRELERLRAVRQQTELNPERSAEVGKQLDQLAKRLADVDPGKSLNDQVEDLRRMQKSVAAQIQDLMTQQAALREMQRSLQSDAERIRQAIEELVRERAKSPGPVK
jgi:beta-lactamase regulating signal transducer with metallopeptidase domain